MVEVALALTGGLVLLLMCGCLPLWIAAVLRLSRKQPIIPLVRSAPAPWDHVEVLVTIGSLIFLLILSTECLRWGGWIDPLITDQDKLPATQLATAMFSASAVQLLVAVLVVLWTGRERIEAKPDAQQRRPVAYLLGVGLVGSAMFIPPAMLVQLIATRIVEYEHKLLDLVQEKPSLEFMLVATFAAVIVAPFAEEVFFRRLLQGWMEGIGRRRTVFRTQTAVAIAAVPAMEAPVGSESPVDPNNHYAFQGTTSELPRIVEDAQPTSSAPPYWPIFMSSALFAGLHIGQGPAPFSLFVLSLGLGYLYRQTQSIIPSMVVHFMLNAITMLMVILTTLAFPDQA